MFDVLKRFDKELTDCVLGNKGYLLPESERIEWSAAVEDNRHVHVLIRCDRLLRYTHDAYRHEQYGHERKLTEDLNERIQRQLGIGKDPLAESIEPYEEHLACAYLVKRGWDRRVADSNERDFIFHSSHFHRDRQAMKTKLHGIAGGDRACC